MAGLSRKFLDDFETKSKNRISNDKWTFKRDFSFFYMKINPGEPILTLYLFWAHNYPKEADPSTHWQVSNKNFIPAAFGGVSPSDAVLLDYVSHWAAPAPLPHGSPPKSLSNGKGGIWKVGHVMHSPAPRTDDEYWIPLLFPLTTTAKTQKNTNFKVAKSLKLW